MTTKSSFRTREEVRLIRTGLKILRDSCEAGPDFTNYAPYGTWSREKLKRDMRKCYRDLKLINRLLQDLKGK